MTYSRAACKRETIDEETRSQLLSMYREVVAEIGEADAA